VDANVVEIDTLPTASIRRRAANLLEIIHRHVHHEPGPIHLVGHSTGGLDARLVVCPNANLRVDAKRELVSRVRTLVTVSTPHFGTPLANTFGGTLGRPVLKLLAVSLFYALEHGRLPIGVGLRLARWVTRLDDYVGMKHTVADELVDKLLGQLGTEERSQLRDFLDGVGNDQALLFQLTEAGCDLLNATTGQPDQIRYASLVTCAKKPDLNSVFRHGVNLYGQGLHAVYGVLYHLAARADARLQPEPSLAAEQVFQRDLGRLLTMQDNDGMVPAESQIWGEVLGAVHADHLDVIGHYGERGNEADADWFPSNSGFTRHDFEQLWCRVADYLALDERYAADAPPSSASLSRASA
jgi:triacylglycerol esterase/lipase EstA (alpha/beta hydrolase family)